MGVNEGFIIVQYRSDRTCSNIKYIHVFSGVKDSSVRQMNILFGLHLEFVVYYNWFQIIQPVLHACKAFSVTEAAKAVGLFVHTKVIILATVVPVYALYIHGQKSMEICKHPFLLLSRSYGCCRSRVLSMFIGVSLVFNCMYRYLYLLVLGQQTFTLLVLVPVWALLEAFHEAVIYSTLLSFYMV